MIDSVSLRPTKKKTQLALETNLLSQEKQNSPSKGRDSKFYCLSEGERAHLLSNRETSLSQYLGSKDVWKSRLYLNLRK